jgi:ribosomal protein L31
MPKIYKQKWAHKKCTCLFEVIKQTQKSVKIIPIELCDKCHASWVGNETFENRYTFSPIETLKAEKK